MKLVHLLCLAGISNVASLASTTPDEQTAVVAAGVFSTTVITTVVSVHKMEFNHGEENITTGIAKTISGDKTGINHGKDVITTSIAKTISGDKMIANHGEPFAPTSIAKALINHKVTIGHDEKLVTISITKGFPRDKAAIERGKENDYEACYTWAYNPLYGPEHTCFDVLSPDQEMSPALSTLLNRMKGRMMILDTLGQPELALQEPFKLKTYISKLATANIEATQTTTFVEGTETWILKPLVTVSTPAPVLYGKYAMFAKEGIEKVAVESKDSNLLLRIHHSRSPVGTSFSDFFSIEHPKTGTSTVPKHTVSAKATVSDDGQSTCEAGATEMPATCEAKQSGIYA